MQIQIAAIAAQVGKNQTMDEFTVMCVNVRQNANAWDWQDANAFFGGISKYLLGNFEVLWGIQNAFWGILNCCWQIRNDGKMNFQSKLN